MGEIQRKLDAAGIPMGAMDGGGGASGTGVTGAEGQGSIAPSSGEVGPYVTCGGGGCRVSAAGIARLDPVFREFGYDVRRVSIGFGPTIKGNGYTLGDSVTLNWGTFPGMDSEKQIGLLAHEITHSVQYDRLGTATFLNRYFGTGGEYYQGRSNYDDAGSGIRGVTMRDLNITDSNYTLDQIANRVRYHVWTGK